MFLQLSTSRSSKKFTPLLESKVSRSVLEWGGGGWFVCSEEEDSGSDLLWVGGLCVGL